ncbi:MAG: hypothetical protein K9L28_00155 [Synergistales bacterium]|nr:hypothetical protein [Synergistales bacterium]
MASPDWRPHLRAELQVRPVPLPLLLSRLRILYVRGAALTETLSEALGDDPFIELVPPPGLQRGSQDQSLERVAGAVSMEEELYRQLSTCPALRRLPSSAIATLLSALDRRGYLRTPLAALSRELHLSADQTEELLHAVQSWVDPPGLFGRGLAEVLLLQLQRAGSAESDAAFLLREYVPQIEQQDVDAVQEATGWPKERIHHALEELARLTPFPAQDMEGPRDSPPMPEIAISFAQKQVRVRLVRENLPTLRFEGTIASRRGAWPFLERESRALLLALAGRYRMMVRIACYAGQRQQRYLEEQSHAPGPCTMRQTAAALGVHPSTVHRAVAGTWATSPRGIVPLEHLFSRPLRARPDLSVDEVRQYIAQGRRMGKRDRRIARELSLPVRTVSYHRRCCR